MVSVRYLLTLAISMWHLPEQSVSDYELEYNMLKNISTGYDYSHMLPPRNINQSTIDRLKLQIIGDLKCSYVFSAMRYYLLSKKLIESGDMVAYLQENSMDRYKFVEEAKTMLTTMKNCGQLKSMDVVWRIYVYSLYVSKRMQRHQTVFVFRCDDFKSNLTTHLTECKENRNQYGYSTSSEDVILLLSRRITFDRLLGLIDEHKETLAKQMTVNETLTRPADGMDDIFDIKRLCLNRVYEKSVMMECLLKDFAELVEWQDTQRRFMGDYNRCTGNKQIENWLAGLGKLHNRIVCILKIIMLQIIWRHGTYISISKPNDWCGTFHCRSTRKTPLKIANTKMIAQISMFVKFVGLGEDDDFMNIENMLSNLLDPRSEINVFYDKLKLILNNLSSKVYDCQRSYPKLLNSAYASRMLELMTSIDTKLAFNTNVSNYDLSDIPKVQESLTSAVVFNRYIQYNFRGVNFEVIQSFIRFTGHLN